MQLISDKIEAERKYLVDVVGELPQCRVLEIFQTYLMAENGENRRIRKITENGESVFIKTTKRALSSFERIEKEWVITSEEYEELMNYANPEKITIHKIRRGFMWDNRYLELDSFICPKLSHCLLEIEDVTKETIISFPPFLKVLEEVTDNPSYYNANIANKR